MPTAPFSHFVFVDLENIPDPDLGSIRDKSVHVTLVIGKNQKKLDLELVTAIHELGGQVELIRAGASGHNALDLVLANRLGRSIERSPAASFHIISGDRDFDPLVTHLQDHGTVVTRHETFASLPFVSGPRTAPSPKPVAHKTVPAKAPPPPRKPPVDREARIVARLRNPASRNRPATRKALSAYLKTALGPAAPESKVQGALDHLCHAGILTIDDAGKVRYTETR